MYLVLDKDNVILYISETLGYQENGNVLVDEGRLAIAAILVKEVKEVAEVPAGIEAAKYCYTAGEGFTENPSYIEPPKPQEEIIKDLEEQVTDLQVAMCDLYEVMLGGDV